LPSDLSAGKKANNLGRLAAAHAASNHVEPGSTRDWHGEDSTRTPLVKNLPIVNNSETFR
jgi:hypothetical protein